MRGAYQRIFSEKGTFLLYRIVGQGLTYVEDIMVRGSVTMYMETSCLRTLKIKPSNLNESTLMNSASVLYCEVYVQYTIYIYIGK